jgi:1,2-phenylacetyl-CoA epoxidase catalytic subunit
LEKTDHAARVLAIMGDFGADAARYAVHRPWSARASRDAELGAQRQGGDMRLSVFHYPLQGWIDAVTFNVLMGAAVGVQLEEFARVSYTPLAEALRVIAPRERRHAELGVEGLRRIVASEQGRGEAQASLAYWRPRVAETFGLAGSARFATLQRFGLRHRRNEDLLADWRARVDAILADLNLL